MPQNAQTFQPIPEELRAPFLKKLGTFESSRPWPIPPVQLIRFLYEFGPHPEVLAHPKESGIQVFNGRVLWRRPKTNRPVGERGRGLLIPEDLIDWVPGFVERLVEPTQHRIRQVTYYVNGVSPEGRKLRRSVPRHREQDFCSEVITYEVNYVTEEMGFPGVSCRCLRHTFLNRIWVKSGKVRSVMDAGAVNEADAGRYSIENPKDAGLDSLMRNRSV